MDPDRDIARASTLAAPCYFTQETFDEEKDRIFSSTWQLIGHAHQVANPGDYFTFDLVGEPLLAVRGEDGILRAFYNVCRHRAGNPATGCGNRKLFRCGYHGWRYDLDGGQYIFNLKTGTASPWDVGTWRTTVSYKGITLATTQLDLKK